VSTSSLSYGAFLGSSGNLRYQILYGLERALHDRFDVLGVVIFTSAALRCVFSIFYFCYMLLGVFLALQIKSIWNLGEE
jgi:hypothetical protein